MTEMAAPISHQLENDLLTVVFEQDELTFPLIEACQEVFDKAFSSGVVDVVLDFQGAIHMDSPFIAMLLVLNKQATEKGAKVKLVGVAERVGKVLESVRVRQFFEEYNSTEDAIAAVRREHGDSAG